MVWIRDAGHSVAVLAVLEGEGARLVTPGDGRTVGTLADLVSSTVPGTSVPPSLG